MTSFFHGRESNALASHLESSEIVADINVPWYWCDEYLQQFNNSYCYQVRYLFDMREGRHQSCIWQLLSCRKKLRKTCFFSEYITVRFHSSVGLTPVRLLDTHIMRTTNLFGFKGADTSLCALNTGRHVQVLDLNAGCILTHQQTEQEGK